MVRGHWARLRPAGVTAAVLAGLLAATFAGTASAEHVAPVLVPGNPSCVDQGYDVGLKLDPVSGTYELPGTGGGTVTVQTDGTFFDWSSTAPLDGAIAKGGANANLYRYSPATNGDTGLHAPINPVTDRPYALSHIELCLGGGGQPRLEVSTTAQTSYTRTIGWALTKDVDGDSHSGLAGNSFASTYTVAVSKTVAESGFTVAGEITVHNPTELVATITSIADSAGGAPATVGCGVPQDLSPGGTLVCPYTASLDSKANGTNTANVETTGLVGGAAASADYAFGEPAAVFGDGSVVVNDTDPAGPKSVTVSEDRTFTYAKAFACSGNAGAYSGGRRFDTYLNTAVATGPATSLTASRTVSVDCRLPGTSERGWPPDVILEISPDVPTAPVGSEVVFTVTVRNRGEEEASGVTAKGTLSEQVDVASLAPSQGTCSLAGNAFDCALGSLAGGASATITVRARVLSGGSILAAASVSGDNEDEVSASTVVLAFLAEPPPPQLGQTVNVFPISGEVFVDGKLLTEGVQIKVGSKVDTSKGIVNLVSFHGTARFKNGVFQVLERRVRRGYTNLRLLGGNFKRNCGHPARSLSGAEGARTHTKKTVRKLWGNGTGSFKTSARYSSATVRGTFWLTADRCDGTLTRVNRGRVVVLDFVLKKRILLRAGQIYLARPPAPSR